MLSQKTFHCNRTCGECCKHLTVKLNKKDIDTIEKVGYAKDYFVEYDSHIKSPVLKLTDLGCVFLKKVKDIYSCSIYEIRPSVCNKYPFINSDKVESCKPVLLKDRFKK